MKKPSFRRNAEHQSPTSARAGPPPPWPVDPELSRRAVEIRALIERTRRQLARDVLPERKRSRKPPRRLPPLRAVESDVGR
jgi:hypothetical protein